MTPPMKSEHATGFVGELPPPDTVGDALRGPHRRFALGDAAGALRYPPTMSPFTSLGPEPAAAWGQLTELPGDTVAVFARGEFAPPAPWRVVADFPLLSLVGPAVDPGPEDGEVVELTSADVPAMLELTALTKPGPFLSETIAFGGYAGIRRNGVLAAMAGRRMHPDGWIEISAVCTHPDHRGAGLARRVMNAVIRGIRGDGALPFLHVLEDNPARHLYESMGFTLGRETRIAVAERSV
jgi:ribosomal protein S18 acetylase RimI-like enzyme